LTGDETSRSGAGSATSNDVEVVGREPAEEALRKEAAVERRCDQTRRKEHEADAATQDDKLPDNRAGGAGSAAFYTRMGIAEGKPVMEFDGQNY
jgi:hypothetical protein